MFLKKVSPRAILSERAYLEKCGKWTYEYLKGNHYDIYFFYDIAEETINYVAYAKDLKDCYLHLAEPRLAFGVSKDGMCSTESDRLSSALLVYCYENEMSMSEEEIRKTYKEVSSISELVGGLTGEEAVKKMEDRKSFTEFLSKIEKAKEEKPQDKKSDKLGVSLSFNYIESSYWGDFLRYSITLIDHKKNCEIKDLFKFCIGFAARSEYSLASKRKIILEPGSFVEPFDKAVPVICGATLFANKKKTTIGDITFDKALPAFEELLDEPFTFCGKRIKINKKDPVSFSLNDKGAPIFLPKRKSGFKETTMIGKKGVYIFDGNKGQISFHSFPSKEMREAYVYFDDERIKRFPYIQDLFNEKLLPKLSSSLKKNETAKEGEMKPFEIALYLTIDENSGLRFKTLYYENGEETKKVASPVGESLKAAYLSLLSSLGGLENGTLKKDEEIVNFLSKDLSPLLNLVTFYCDERLKRKNVSRSVSSLHLSFTRNGDFLSFTLDSDRYTDSELEGMIKAYKQKRKYYLLKNGLCFLEGEGLKEAASYLDEGKLSNDHLPLYKLFSIDKENYKVDEDTACENILSDVKNYKDKEVKLEKKTQEFLRPYQLEAVKYLSALHSYSFGAILADEMGLGKTLEAIGYISSLTEEKPVLIVAPKAVLYNWESEIAKFSSLPCVVIDASKEAREKTIKGIKKNKKVLYCVSYDTFKRDEELFSNISFSTVILDEAQSIKNAFSRRHQALLSLKADSKVALTGTPLENSPFDLWSIFNILMPGYLGDEKEFNELLKREDASKRLSLLLKPFMLRRRKADVLADLPSKSESNILVSMNEGERMLYLAHLQKARALSSESKISILASLTRLRQLCVDPSSFLEGVDTSTKLLYTVELVKESIASGHKIIVFSSFKTALLDLRELLEEEDIPLDVITGDTSGKDRLEIATSFNTKDDTKVLLVSLKAGGVGLNLVGADTVIHLDPWWNPQVENQASDRVHRIGQTRSVSIIRLIMKDTIEEKVLNLQEEKKDLYNEIVEGNGGVSSLSDEDIKYLLS